MGRADLIAGKHDALELDPEACGGRPRGREIGAKRLAIAALLQAIEVRKSMRGHLLVCIAENSPDERQAVIVVVMLFVGSDLWEIVIRGYSRVGIARLALGKCGEHLLVGREKQQADGGPGAGDRPPGEEIE